MRSHLFNIIVLDACRNNPLSAHRGGGGGLAPVTAPKGSFVAYSTAPGKIALDGDGINNSPYTLALAQTLTSPGLRLEDVFKKTRELVLASTGGEQVPFESTSITGDFYFSDAPLLEQPVLVTPVVPSIDPLAADFDLARSLNSTSGWDLFLAHHGTASDMRVEVGKQERQRLAMLDATVQASDPPVAEDAFETAYKYDLGKGVKQNDKLAAKWYKIAADQGDTAAQRNLAGMYGEGRGVKKDQVEARRLSLLAANQGDAQAQYILGKWFSSSQTEKIKWLRTAAAQKHVDAIKTLAIMKVPLAEKTNSTENFEFVVKGQAGLQLRIFGFGYDGSKMFTQESSRPESRNDGLSYVVRVDENTLGKKSLGQWCVLDLTRKWSLLPKDRPDVALCDDQPFETRGSYKFTPRSERKLSAFAGELGDVVEQGKEPEKSINKVVANSVAKGKLVFPIAGTIVRWEIFFKFTTECENDHFATVVSPTGRELIVMDRGLHRCSGKRETWESPNTNDAGVFLGTEAKGEWKFEMIDLDKNKYTGTLDEFWLGMWVRKNGKILKHRISLGGLPILIPHGNR